MLEHELWGEEGPGAGLVPSAEHLLGISKVNEFSFLFPPKVSPVTHS